MNLVKDLKENWDDWLISYLYGFGVYSVVAFITGISFSFAGLFGLAMSLVLYRAIKVKRGLT